MAISHERYRIGEKAAVTDGHEKITFDTPSDFADWLSRNGEVLHLWQWCRP
jgi:hypothetical protein